MSNYSILAPGLSIGRNVKIGLFTAVFLGANVIHRITIGDHTIIGNGSTVVKNIYKIKYCAWWFGGLCINRTETVIYNIKFICQNMIDETLNR